MTQDLSLLDVAPQNLTRVEPPQPRRNPDGSLFTFLVTLNANGARVVVDDRTYDASSMTIVPSPIRVG